MNSPVVLLCPLTPSTASVAVEIRRFWGDVGFDPRTCEGLLLVRQPLSQFMIVQRTLKSVSTVSEKTFDSVEIYYSIL